MWALTCTWGCAVATDYQLIQLSNLSRLPLLSSTWCVCVVRFHDPGPGTLTTANILTLHIQLLLSMQASNSTDYSHSGTNNRILLHQILPHQILPPAPNFPTPNSPAPNFPAPNSPDIPTQSSDTGLQHTQDVTVTIEAVLAVTVGHRTNSGQGCNVSGQICYLSGHK